MAEPTRAEFLQFIQAKRLNVVCEVCGQNNWSIPERDGGLLVAIPIAPSGGNFVIPPPSIGAALMVCSNCGNIRMHAMAIVKP